jgi:type VI secretion system secreted protein Hcp
MVIWLLEWMRAADQLPRSQFSPDLQSLHRISGPKIIFKNLRNLGVDRSRTVVQDSQFNGLHKQFESFREKKMAAYIKFDGVDGESKADKHEKWSDLESFGQGIHKAGSGATGAARRRGTVLLDDIQCTKLMDKSSPKIAEAVCLGKVFPKVNIHVMTSTTGTGREPYYQYELINVMVTSYQVTGGDQDKPHETFSLNFEEIKVTYTEMDEKGSKKGDVKYGWKVEEGVKV